MIRTGQPHASSDVTEEASTPAGQPRAEQGGEKPSVASQKPTKDSEFLWMDWHRMWEQGLGPVTINEHRSPGSLNYADLPLPLLGAPVSIEALVKLGSRSLAKQDRD